MHAAWDIEDIVVSICGFLDRADLASLACTSNSITNIPSTSLWKYHASMKGLLKLFPSVMGVENSPGVAFSTPPTFSDWDEFVVHAGIIQHMKQPQMVGIQPITLQTLTLYRPPVAVLFLRLSKLEWTASNRDELAVVNIFLSSSITECRLILEGASTVDADGVNVLLGSLAHVAPNVKVIKISQSKPQTLFQPAFAVSRSNISRFKNLRRIRIPVHNRLSSTLQYLSQLSKLEDVYISISAALTTEVDNTLPPFPSLKSFAVAGTVADCTTLVDRLRADELQNLSVYVQGEMSDGQLQALWPAMTLGRGGLVKIKLTALEATTALNIGVLFAGAEALTVKEFEFTHSGSFGTVPETWPRSIQTTWPNIEHLTLSAIRGGQLGISSVMELLDRCPKIISLAISPACEPVPDFDTTKPVPSLCEMVIYPGVVKDPLAVAMFLSGTFPSARIRLTSDANKEWNEVIRILPELRKLIRRGIDHSGKMAW